MYFGYFRPFGVCGGWCLLLLGFGRGSLLWVGGFVFDAFGFVLLDFGLAGFGLELRVSWF